MLNFMIFKEIRHDWLILRCKYIDINTLKILLLYNLLHNNGHNAGHIFIAQIFHSNVRFSFRISYNSSRDTPDLFSCMYFSHSSIERAPSYLTGLLLSPAGTQNNVGNPV